MKMLFIILLILTIGIFKYEDNYIKSQSDIQIYKGIVLPCEIKKLNYVNQDNIIFIDI